MATNERQDPWAFTLEFETFLLNLLDSWTGMKSTFQFVYPSLTDGKPDMNAVPELKVISEIDTNANPLCNYEGGKYLCNHLRMLLNKHVALGDLRIDQIAEIAGNTVKQPIDYMMFNSSQFAPQKAISRLALASTPDGKEVVVSLDYIDDSEPILDTNKLEVEGLALYDSLFTYLTSLKEAGMRELGKAMVTVTYTQKEEPDKEKQGMFKTGSPPGKA